MELGRRKQGEDTIALLQKEPTITEDGRLIVPENFEFTKTEVDVACRELLDLAEMSTSNALVVPKEISNALESYKNNEHDIQIVIESALSDRNILQALLANVQVNKFFVTVRRSTCNAIQAFGTNLNKIIGHSEGSGQPTEKLEGSTSKVTRSVSESFALAIRQFSELLKRTWNFLCGKGSKVVESFGSTLNSMGEWMEERLQSFIMLLLAVFRRNFDRRMYGLISNYDYDDMQ